MRLEFEPNVAPIPFVNNESLEETTASRESDLELLLQKGIAAAQAGDRRFARILLNHAAEIDPKCEDAWMWLASVSEYPEELLVFLDKVLAINPDNQKAVEWQTATNSLMANNFAGRAAEALSDGSHTLVEEFVNKALQHDENCLAAWSVKAEAESDEDKRSTIYSHILELDPTNETASAFIADLEFSRTTAVFDAARSSAAAGNNEEAFASVDQYLAVKPDDVDAWVFRSHVAPTMDEKIASLEKAVELDPSNTLATAGLQFLSSANFNAPAAVVEEVEVNGSKVETDIELETGAFDEDAMEASLAPVEEESHFEEPDTEEPPFEAETLMFEDPSVTEENVYSEPEYVEEPAALVAEHEVVEVVEDASVGSENAYKAIEMFANVDESAVAEMETIESSSPFTETVDDDIYSQSSENWGDQYEVSEAPNAEFASFDATVFDAPAEGSSPAEFASSPDSSAQECPFCKGEIVGQAFDCNYCGSVLSLSDIEAIFANNTADQAVVQNAVTQMEAEWNLREFDENEFRILALGHLNLKNYRAGHKYLTEASRVDPNDVILAGQVNTLAIRLEEMERRTEVNEASRQGKTILVVDDSPTVRKLISGKLEKSGHTVICAVDGVDALEQLNECSPDLVLLDITMPRMDGYDVCKQIRSNPDLKDMPVVMISGKDGFFDKVRGRMAGTTGYVTKPFGPETLMKALDTYLLPDNDAA